MMETSISSFIGHHIPPSKSWFLLKNCLYVTLLDSGIMTKYSCIVDMFLWNDTLCLVLFRYIYCSDHKSIILLVWYWRASRWWKWMGRWVRRVNCRRSNNDTHCSSSIFNTAICHWWFISVAWLLLWLLSENVMDCFPSYASFILLKDDCGHW